MNSKYDLILSELDQAAAFKPGSIVMTSIYGHAAKAIRELSQRTDISIPPVAPLCWPWRHHWKITKTEILTSFIEQLKEAGIKSSEGGDFSPHEKPCIVTKECQNCGTEKVERI